MSDPKAIGNNGASVSHIGNTDIIEPVQVPIIKRGGIRGILDDVYEYRTTYLVTVVACFGGMLYGWDTGYVLQGSYYGFVVQVLIKRLDSLEGSLQCPRSRSHSTLIPKALILEIYKETLFLCSKVDVFSGLQAVSTSLIPLEGGGL